MNSRIDQLAGYLEQKGRPNPASLNFKQLKGDPVKWATHEFYAWSDNGAHRVFGHYGNDCFVLDSLGKHL